MIHASKGNHANHPGHSNANCPLRMQINAAAYGTSHNGYACSWTGGHCVKSEACESRVAEHESTPQIPEHILMQIQEKEMHKQGKHS